MPLDVRISSAELDLYKRVLATRPASYMSFGISSISRRAAASGVKKIVVTDSVPARLDFCMSDILFKQMMARGDASVLRADIGPVTEWGNPIGVSDIQRWPNYISGPWKECESQKFLPEIIHVQGRFRVACALSVGIAWPERFGQPSHREPLVLLHDISEERPHYAAMLEFFDVIRRAETLVLARWKPSASRTKAFNLFLTYQFDPR